jgi:hypothetical protein
MKKIIVLLAILTLTQLGQAADLNCRGNSGKVFIKSKKDRFELSLGSRPVDQYSGKIKTLVRSGPNEEILELISSEHNARIGDIVTQKSGLAFLNMDADGRNYKFNCNGYVEPSEIPTQSGRNQCAAMCAPLRNTWGYMPCIINCGG